MKYSEVIKTIMYNSVDKERYDPVLTWIKSVWFCVCFPSCMSLGEPLWTVAHQASLSIGFPRQDYWSGFPFPSPRDLPHSGSEPASPALQADLNHRTTWEAPCVLAVIILSGRITRACFFFIDVFIPYKFCENRKIMIRKKINNDFCISLKRLLIKKPEDKNQSRKFPYNLKDRNQLAAEHAIWIEFTRLLLNRKASSFSPDQPASVNYGQGSVISHLSAWRPGSTVQFTYFSVLHPPQSHPSFKDLLSTHPVPGAELSIWDSEDRKIQSRD